MTDEQYIELLEELERLEGEGVSFDIDGEVVEPLDVVHAHMVRERPQYMRDYVEDGIGKVKKVKFNTIRY